MCVCVCARGWAQTVIGRSVVVKLNSGVEYRGVLTCLDGFMNIALEYCEECVVVLFSLPFCSPCCS